MRLSALLMTMLGFAACHLPPVPPVPTHAATVTLSVVGTNDLHGQVDRLPVLAGFVDNLRRARTRDGGAVLLVDGGDLFQGTLESNLAEGEPVIRAYNVMGYDASAIGNHEFDFGPVGPDSTPRGPTEDPRGALKARAQAAHFPMMAVNLIDVATGKTVDWPNMPGSVLRVVDGVKVGIIGAATPATPRTTIAANFVGLRVAPIAETVAREAARLREAGATVVVLAVHAGGRCRRFDNPDDLSSCDPHQEIFAVAAALPHGAVDVIVAGHTHAGVAKRVAGIPVIESYSNGRAFGRVDLTVERASGRVLGARIFPPHELCTHRAPAACDPGSYAGEPVLADARVATAIAPFVARARALREKRLGVTLMAPVRRSYEEESALGNLFADLMRAAQPDADVALQNAGGLRADLPAGPLTYGELYQANPFDNRFAEGTIDGAELRHLIARNLERGGGILSVSGVRVTARCEKGALAVSLTRPDRSLIQDRDRLRIVTSDFLATGGDGLFGAQAPAFTIEDRVIRDAMAKALERRGGRLGGRDPALFDPAHRRLTFPGTRPVHCGTAPAIPPGRP